MNLQLRAAAVAGYFYSGEKSRLEKELSELLPAKKEKVRARAIVVPHAGYMYSGSVAGEVYASVELPETFIILCPNHTGSGSDFDLWSEGEWSTPLGSAQVDVELCRQLMRNFPRSVTDGTAHLREHSLEVQLPFLQYLKEKFSFVPLCIRQWDYSYLEDLGHALAKIVSSAGRDVLIIASSDMTHYESQQSAEKKDRLAIQQMELMNPKGLYDTVHENDISMCGYLPATAAMIAAKDLGATSGRLLKYATSGDVTRDYSSVVGYAGLIF
ncbi:AmmeMemoRadiSam system protein B [bacterium]|nr:AmmeMemoRadiSam system protein B [bacterium]MCI0605006.1 AmmeMemoRadiSam system protein B [bacterium]